MVCVKSHLGSGDRISITVKRARFARDRNRKTASRRSLGFVVRRRSGYCESRSVLPHPAPSSRPITPTAVTLIHIRRCAMRQTRLCAGLLSKSTPKEKHAGQIRDCFAARSDLVRQFILALSTDLATGRCRWWVCADRCLDLVFGIRAVPAGGKYILGTQAIRIAAVSGRQDQLVPPRGQTSISRTLTSA